MAKIIYDDVSEINRRLFERAMDKSAIDCYLIEAGGIANACFFSKVDPLFGSDTLVSIDAKNGAVESAYLMSDGVPYQLKDCGGGIYAHRGTETFLKIIYTAKGEIDFIEVFILGKHKKVMV